MIKEVNDYVDDVHEKFPDLSRDEVKKIMQFGWRMYHYFNKCGADVSIVDWTYNKFLMHTGILRLDSFKHYLFTLFKHRVKTRLLFKLRLLEWDGYYYFGLTEEKYKDYLEQKAKPRKKIFKFEGIYMYKLFDEVKFNKGFKYIFKTKYPDIGYKFYLKKYATTECEPIFRRTDNGLESINNP